MTVSEQGSGRRWVPVDACTMPAVEQPLRMAEFDALFAETATEVNRVSPTQGRLLLVGATGLVDRVRDLADRESGCCSFFTFIVTPVEVPGSASQDGPITVHLDVSVPGSRSEVLAALLGRAETVAGSSS